MSSIVELLKERINQVFAGKQPWQVSRDTIVALVTLYCAFRAYQLVKRRGLKAVVMGFLLKAVSSVPGANAIVEKQKQDAARDLRKSMIPEDVAKEALLRQLPKKGMPRQELMATLARWSQRESQIWGRGKASGAIYHGGAELVQTLSEAYSMFALSNPLHPDLFPYVRKMESEVVRMTLSLFNGDDNTCGSMTCGGTESILMAIKAYRDQAYAERGVTEPELVACATAHAAFEKACAYFKIKLVSIDADPRTQKLDAAKVRAAINSNTIALVGSAPQFPHGVVDPIPELSRLAVEYKIGLHVDCCLGSFVIPFARKLGYTIPAFDFSLPGVTSISADTHKYGYSVKGSSVIMFRNEKLRHYMYFVTTGWPGGIYASPTITGSRPGALVAATWAALVSIGSEAYEQAAMEILAAAKKIREGVRKIPGLCTVGEAMLFVVAFGVDRSSPLAAKLDIYKISEAMSKLFHWNLNALQNPACVHLCVTFANKNMSDQFLVDLSKAVQAVLDTPERFKGGSVQIYGVAEALGNGASDNAGESSGLLADMAKIYIDTLTYLPPADASASSSSSSSSTSAK